MVATSMRDEIAKVARDYEQKLEQMYQDTIWGLAFRFGVEEYVIEEIWEEVYP